MPNMIKPNKTQILISTVIVLAVAGLVGGSAYLYQTNRKAEAGPSYSQLKSERDDAVKAMVLHDNVNKQRADTLNAQVQTLTVQKASVCTSLKTTKVTNVNCN